MMRLLFTIAFLIQSAAGPVILACASQEAKCTTGERFSCCTPPEGVSAGDFHQTCCCSGDRPSAPTPDQPKPAPSGSDRFAADLPPAAGTGVELPAVASASADSAPGAAPTPNHHTRQAVLCRWTT